MFLYRVVKALEAQRVRYAIVGGYAVALHGAVRGTVDLDLVLALDRAAFLGAEKAFSALGLKARLPVTGGEVFDFRKEYLEKRNLVAWSFSHPDNALEVIDVILTHDARKMKVVRVKSGDVVLKVASIPDLIEMKTASGRPQDVEDVKALRKLL